MAKQTAETEGDPEGGEHEPDSRENPQPDAAGRAVDESRVREIVEEVVDRLLGDSELAEPPGETSEEPPARRGPAAVEADFEGKVRSEINKIRGEEEKEGRLKKLEDTLFAEAAPVKQRRLERAVWGRRG